MTLTLDEVRRVRFRMARRGGQGYEVSDVDNFVDKVEESFNRMTNDAELLQRQIESLQSQPPASPFVQSDNSEQINELRGELDTARAELTTVRGELDMIRGERDAARREAEEARTNQLKTGAGNDERAVKLAEDFQRISAENEKLRAELEQARQRARSNQNSENTPLERLIVTTSAEASPAVVRLVQLATEQAEQVVMEADNEAKRKVAEADQRAFEITTDARTKADRVESEARVAAEKVTSEAQAHAEQVTREADEAAEKATNDTRAETERMVREASYRAGQIDREAVERRRQMFAALESERDDLSAKVERLRGFEASFRVNLTEHLKTQLAALENADTEPLDVPELAVRRPGNTPRLDALMGDNR